MPHEADDKEKSINIVMRSFDDGLTSTRKCAFLL
jgi:hypothetical protein